MLVRRIARPMLASTFVAGGVDAMLHPQTTQAVTESAARGMTRRIPKAPDLDGDTAVRVDGAVMAAAGAMLAMGRMPRVAAVLLLAAVTPTLVERARDLKNDEKSDPQERAAKRMAFLGGLGVVGGLLIAAADTEGKPSLTRRAGYAGAAAGRVTKQARRELQHTAKHTARGAKHTARGAKHTAREAALATKAATARIG